MRQPNWAAVFLGLEVWDGVVVIMCCVVWFGVVVWCVLVLWLCGVVWCWGGRCGVVVWRSVAASAVVTWQPPASLSPHSGVTRSHMESCEWWWHSCPAAHQKTKIIASPGRFCKGFGKARYENWNSLTKVLKASSFFSENLSLKLFAWSFVAETMADCVLCHI